MGFNEGQHHKKPKGKSCCRQLLFVEFEVLFEVDAVIDEDSIEIIPIDIDDVDGLDDLEELA